jgi:protein MPE1
VDNDFVCPSCKSPIRSLDKLNMDKPTRTRVMDYIDKALAAANAEIEAAELSKASSSTPRVSQQITHPQTPEPARSKSQEPNTKQPEDDKKPEHSENLQASLYEAPPQSQPGYQESQTLEQIQAEIHQLQTMIQTAKLPPHARNQAMMKLTQKQTLLNQAQTMQMLLSQAQSMAAAEAAMYQNYNAMQQGGYGGYPGQAGYGNNMGSGWNQQQQQQRSSAVPPPSNDSDSPYQRLPVNPRRKVVKRERPSDFVEVSGRGHYDS